MATFHLLSYGRQHKNKPWLDQAYSMQVVKFVFWKAFLVSHTCWKLWPATKNACILFYWVFSTNCSYLVCRGRGGVTGFLKIGYKKLFLLVSRRVAYCFVPSLAFRCSVWNPGRTLSVLCSGSPECPRWSGAPVCFGFLHCGKPTATWLWTRALWLHAAGEQFFASDVLLHLISKLCHVIIPIASSPKVNHVCF